MSENEIDNSFWHILPNNEPVSIYDNKSYDSQIIDKFEPCKVFKVAETYGDWLRVCEPESAWINMRNREGKIVAAIGDATVGAEWRYIVVCKEGAYVRSGIELQSDHIKTESFGTIVHSYARNFNNLGLARIKIASGWVSEMYNPMSGQSGKIIEQIPLLVPLRFRVTLEEGCVVRRGMELSSAVVKTIPFGDYVDIIEKKWTDHPSSCCIQRFRLFDK